LLVRRMLTSRSGICPMDRKPVPIRLCYPRSAAGKRNMSYLRPRAAGGPVSASFMLWLTLARGAGEFFQFLLAHGFHHLPGSTLQIALLGLSALYGQGSPGSLLLSL